MQNTTSVEKTSHVKRRNPPVAPDPDRDVVRSNQVAFMLGLEAVETFYRQRDDLMDLHGFPKPLPPQSTRPRWSKSQVQAWIDNGGNPLTTS